MVTNIRESLAYFIQTALMLLIAGCVPTGVSTTSTVSKTIIYSDHNYEDYVGNVIINSTNPFVVAGSDIPLIIEFDLLTKNFENLQIRYIHCNYDWTPSKLPDMQFLKSFNRFDHSNFNYSINTKRSYIQYFFNVTKPYVSGNYLIVLHRRGNSDDVLFTRKVVFYKDQVNVNAKLHVPTQVKQRATHQQMDVELNYSTLEAPNPQQNFKMVIMQNKDWETAIKDLKASAMQPSSKKMEWKYSTGETSFPGWNQFRFLDLRTLNLRGMNIASIENRESGVMVAHALEGSFGNDSYRQLINDNNGRMLPGNSDPGESYLEADYATVQFALNSEKLNGKIWLTGRFNDWKRDNSNLMKYDEENGVYFTSIRLKQGYYDYRYEVISDDYPRYEFEGSHYQTENEYDILIYYRAPGKINDEVVGIKSLNSSDFF